jgi:predicted signal transduction protein with EAL and GGDEF domain
MNIASRVIKELEAPIRCGGQKHSVGVGIGIALIPRDGTAAEEILRKADIALYRAKRDPAASVHFFDDLMDQQARERDRIECELGAAIGTETLRPFYQPIVDLNSGEVIQFEALARWSHPSMGEILPDRFIPIAEDSYLIRELTDWLLRCAASDAKKWPDKVCLSFNISPVLLRDPTFGLRILSILGEMEFSPHRLEIEITENALVRDFDAARDTLVSLREAGVRIALDDFGTGCSSLYYLRSLKIDKIKIDQSFVHAMSDEAESSAIVRALTDLGHGLGLKVTAEGIEAIEEKNALLLQGCDQGQGYFFSPAVPASETGAFFIRNANEYLRLKSPA